MSESPFKPTSSLRHRRQSSTAMSGMSPNSYSAETEFRRNSDVEAASRSLGEAMNHQSSAEQELAKISQAMTLLSLHRDPARGSAQFTSPAAATPASPTSQPWPSSEETLKESLRRSLSAFHALNRIKSLIESPPGSGEEGERDGEGIVQIMGLYERVASEMNAAAQALAQQCLSQEQEAVRERLLKG